MNLTYLTTEELSILDKANTFVIMPLGSVEQHGPHLPFGTKTFIAESVAFMAANLLKKEEYSYIIAPTLPYIPCQNNAGFQSFFSMSARTYSDALYDIGSSFANDGFKCLFFVNMSVSPDALKAVDTAIQDLNTLPDFMAFDPMPLWNFSNDEKIDEFLKNINIDSKNEIHADIKETSALLYLDQTLIKYKNLETLPDCNVNKSWEMLKGNFSFKEMGSINGYLGSPSKASKELGNLYLQQASLALAESMKFVSQGNALPELPLTVRMLLKMVDLDEM